LEYVPVAVNCCVCDIPMVGLAGVTAMDTNVIPMPDNGTPNGLLLALLFRERLPMTLPVDRGANFTAIVQLAEAASVDEQVFV
jgi:hypothetical protein